MHRPALQDKQVRGADLRPDRQKLIDVVYQGYGKVAIEPIAPISWPLTLKASTLTLTIRHRPKSCWMRPAGNVRRRYPRQRRPAHGADPAGEQEGAQRCADPHRQGELAADWRAAEAAGGGFQRPDGAAQSRNYDLASFSTSTLNDPHDGVWDFYSSEAKESGYHNAEVDKLINAGNAVLDIEQRKPITTSCIKCWPTIRR